MVNAPVFQPVFSAPRPACLSTTEPTLWLEPRSTCRNLVAADEQNLLLLARAPSTALSGDSAAAQAAEPVAVLPWARLVPRLGGAAGWGAPAVEDRGTAPGPGPHADGGPPIVYCRVPPAARSG